MTIKSVLFDFSGTLFRIEPVDTWLSAVLDASGIALPDAELARCARELEEAGALPGGANPLRLPDQLADLWTVRDRSGELHRETYTGLARQVELPDPRLYDLLYDRHKTPAAWQPYPDAKQVLGGCGSAGSRSAW